jgi:hypothetical protein
MMGLMKCALLLVIILLAGCDYFLHVRGVVRNTDGGPISGASVLLEHAGHRFMDRTDSSGCFSAGGAIAPGDYKYNLRVEAEGYQAAMTEVGTTTVNENVLVVLARKGSRNMSRTQKASQLPCRD